MTNGDFDIVADIKAGKPRAFQQLYELLYKKLCYFTEGLINDKGAAEEIVADTFNKFYQLRQNFDSLKSIESFFYITSRNAAYNHLRAFKRQSVLQQEALALIANNDRQDDSNALNSMIEAEWIDQIYQQIEQLPERRKAVFKLFYLQDYSVEQIASELGINIQTVRNTRRDAIDQLKNILGQRKLLIGLISLLVMSVL